MNHPLKAKENKRSNLVIARHAQALRILFDNHYQAKGKVTLNKVA